MNSPTNVAYIGIGSNLGDKMKNCMEAIQAIHRHPDCRVMRVSSFYETEPLTRNGKSVGGWYVNGVIKIRTRLNVVNLLQMILDLEIQMGRIRPSEKWAPRPIDLDLLFFNDEIIKMRPLKIPHPELHKRRFVLEPFPHIQPPFFHPIKGISIQALLAQLVDNKKVVPLFKFYLTRNASEALSQN